MSMIRTGEEYRNAIRAGRDIRIDGARVEDVTRHPAFRPLVDIRARIHDMQLAEPHRDLLTVTESGRTRVLANQLPFSQADWWAKRRASDHILNEIGGVATRIGDDSVGEMWSLQDAEPVLNEIDPQFGPNIRRHIDRVLDGDPFLVSANTDPRGDRSRLPHQQDPDLLLRAVRETDAGIVVRGAKFETGAAYAEFAYTKSAIANWGDATESDYALGFVCDLNAPGLRFICRSGFARPGREEDEPISNRFDESEALVVFDDVLIPWEDVLFYRHTRAATFVHATLRRYTGFTFLQRALRNADLLIGTALLAVRQTGLESLPAVQEKLARLAVWREGINAHLTAAVSLGERSPAGMMMPNQSLLHAGRVHAVGQLYEMMQITRELCGGQVNLLPSAADFHDPETGPWLQKYLSAGEGWMADDRRRLLAFARDLVSSSRAGHWLSYQLFGQSPPYAHLATVYHTFGWEGPAALVREAAGLEGGLAAARLEDSAVGQWFSQQPPRRPAAPGATPDEAP